MPSCSALTLWLSVVVSLCFQVIADTPVPTKTLSFAEIFAHSNPIVLYREAYPGFEVNSTTELRTRKNNELFTRQGFTRLHVFQKQSGFSLNRKLLSIDQSIELSCTPETCLLKRSNQANTKHIGFQTEFQRWQDATVQEILSLYKQIDFVDWMQRDPSQKAGQSCWSNGSASLCVSPQTNLPMEGEIDINISSSSVLSLSFAVTIDTSNVGIPST